MTRAMPSAGRYIAMHLPSTACSRRWSNARKASAPACPRSVFRIPTIAGNRLRPRPLRPLAPRTDVRSRLLCG
jgi:hypothetical protein